MRHTVTVKYRLTSYRCRIKKHFSTCYSHGSRCFRKPLVPAYTNPYTSKSCIKHLKACITRNEVELFLIIMVIRNVRFSVYAKISAIGIYNCNSVIKLIDVFFIKAHYNNYSKFFSNLCKMFYSLILICFSCIFIILISSFLTKVLPLKKLWKQYYIGTFLCCFSYKSVGCLYIF